MPYAAQMHKLRIHAFAVPARDRASIRDRHLGQREMSTEIVVGSRVPHVKLGYLSNGDVATVNACDLFAGARSVVLGIPGAFTPVCTRQHVPDFVANADEIAASGYSQLICIAPNDPFTLETWRAQVDPQSKIRFLSDGNLDFCRALGLNEAHRDLFLGQRSKRYLLLVNDGVIQRVRVESSILTYACTRAEHVLMEDVLIEA